MLVGQREMLASAAMKIKNLKLKPGQDMDAMLKGIDEYYDEEADTPAEVPKPKKVDVRSQFPISKPEESPMLKKSFRSLADRSDASDVKTYKSNSSKAPSGTADIHNKKYMKASEIDSPKRFFEREIDATKLKKNSSVKSSGVSDEQA